MTTTLDSKAAADALAEYLVREQLAACVQVQGPIVSTYRWREKMEQAEEWLCLTKTDAGHFEAVKKAILKHHSYEEPEIVATEIVAGSSGYLTWLRKQLA